MFGFLGGFSYAMPHLEFQILGPLEVRAGGRHIPLRGAKHQIVLGTLLTSDAKRASIGRLVDAVWGERPPCTAEKQVRNAVSDLRRVLGSGSAITSYADGYALRIGGADLDLHAFCDRVERAHRHLENSCPADALTEFRAALSLWTGPALSGLDSSSLQTQVAGLNEERLSVFEECMELELACGNHARIIGELGEWVAEHPLRERLVAQYILALHRCSDRARAFSVYERTRRTLAETLGLDPGPELQELHRRMLAAPALPPVLPPVPALPALGRSNLPHGPGVLVGRGRELSALLARGRSDAAGSEEASAGEIVVVDGMAGVGKTAFALHAARRLVSYYPDGQFFLDMRGYAAGRTRLSPAEGLARLLRLTGVPEALLPSSTEDLAMMWRERLAGRRVLLVLDDVATAEQIEPLLPPSSRCLTLVTSRRCLNLLWPAHLMSLDVLSPGEAGELFRALTDGAHVECPPKSEERLVRYCGRLPLAVAVVATRLRFRPSWSVCHLVTRLADPRRRLTELQTENGGVVSSFDVSYRCLDGWQQLLLSSLSQGTGEVFDTMEAAGVLGLSLDRTDVFLEELVDEHLLQQPEPGRYRMHELLKIYCVQAAELREGLAASLGGAALAADNPR